ncbi:phosphonate ABC transporter, permease protein PhnE [Falsiroseomonas stagni]|uniref:Phosphonate transport system permease protein n=1 Tax=Falsiroseomonas stagni DSM 19981 TaxID=1123062 RepID=A0A1I4AEE0_9PROT|nr:phosphonate ABC transporter, permease protein PhnE [Falsiroseomonas stagni]SFK54311.1 phosphonate transport system permease protein [Falsiroseomonas stagni DSM 19981]
MTRALAAEAAWQRARRHHRRQWLLWSTAFLFAMLLASWVGEVDLARLLRGLPMAADYVWRTIPTLRVATLGEDLAEWLWGLDVWVVLLLDTLLIAYAGTLLGAVAALVCSFPAAATLAPRWAMGPARRVLEFARTVPTLVFALIFVYAFGLGPFAGVLALVLHSWGALGKQFAEVHENADLRTVEAIRAAGGAWPQAMRYGVLPQSLPDMLSFGLLRFEINVREASVLGIVGAGGIGEELYLSVRQFSYPDISAILLLILLTVTAIDLACGWLRHRIIGPGAAAGA